MDFKTICFLTNGGVHRNYGGLDRVTEILADYFEKNGYTVYYLSHVERPEAYNDRQIYFPDKNRINSEENVSFFNLFIKNKHIDVILNQEGNVDLNLPLNDENKKVIKITALHFNPNYITDYHFVHKFSKLTLPTIFRRALTHVFEVPQIKKIALDYLRKKLRRNYYINCKQCDRFVLLSGKFKKDFSDLFKGGKVPYNVSAINNPIILHKKDIDFSKKKKKILYVGRLECGMKQLDKLLRIWKSIANKNKDWSFHLVGGGPDEAFLKKIVLEEAIPRVFFEGIQNPEKFYEESSVFCFSSSSSEGWGMVLVEAQSYGCVPVAFNSYSAVSDIITHANNGFLVPAYDENVYIESLQQLIDNDSLRTRLAENAMQNVKRFEINAIGEKWINLLTEIQINK